ncbi:DUF4298 domain-containing protein [Ruminococcus sp.]|uniref:DUF4298 domain-containing protein n=1 Tax=Ruminococcus sp. TaxID=41978 RepID=UPI0025D95613|nr:DUF4298 domain-containing protein [Ruminococcus sp.]
MDNTELKGTVKRIREMEKRFDRAASAGKRLEAALKAYEKALADIAALKGYYRSDNWKHDFQADESGELPDGLKRGVLSEDGVWDFLNDNDELVGYIKKLSLEL